MTQFTGRARRQPFVAVFVSAAVAASLACGSSSPTSPTATPTPAQPTTTSVFTGSQTGILPGTPYAVVVTTSTTGTLTATLNWTFPSTTIAFSWGQGNCLTNPNCSPIAGTGSAVNATEATWSTASAVPPGTYTLGFSTASTNQTEAVAISVVLTSS